MSKLEDEKVKWRIRKQVNNNKKSSEREIKKKSQKKKLMRFIWIVRKPRGVLSWFSSSPHQIGVFPLGSCFIIAPCSLLLARWPADNLMSTESRGNNIRRDTRALVLRSTLFVPIFLCSCWALFSIFMFCCFSLVENLYSVTWCLLCFSGAFSLIRFWRFETVIVTAFPLSVIC